MTTASGFGKTGTGTNQKEKVANLDILQVNTCLTKSILLEQ